MPKAPPVPNATVPNATVATAIDDAVAGLAGRTIAVLTGAGISTDSGIPDYRGEGSPVRVPMTFSQFLSDEAYRKRYWAGSQLGWKRFAAVAPNPGHEALAGLETAGLVNGVMTQNVDGLHLKAGSRRVVELHGAARRVRCLACGQVFAREVIAQRIEDANPWLSEPGAVELGPDGDVEVGHLDELVLPTCTVCDGMLKPDIVYFGEFIPVPVFAQAQAIVRSADALVIAGSSLVVNSGIRLLDLAARKNLPVVIINRGPTRGDSRAAVKIDAGTSETLPVLAARLIR